MALTLTVDTEVWRAHLAETLAANPGLVPVIKGNGYGFGKTLLAEESARLGVDTVAVGQYDEVASVSEAFAGSVLVLTPAREVTDADLDNPRLIHTISRVADLRSLVEAGRPVRVVLERVTSMLRHGMTQEELTEATRLAGESDSVTVAGLTLHFPLELVAQVESEARQLLDGADLPALAQTAFVSHLTAGETRALEREHPGLTIRPRTGTELWLGATTARRVTATILDVHAVERGQLFGYRKHRAGKAGTLLVVSGGTSHGIGVETAVAATDWRTRGRAAARGVLESFGYLRSPYFLDGQRCRFAEPPHMQVSMLWLPPGLPEPSVGDRLDVRVRPATTDVDSVLLV